MAECIHSVVLSGGAAYAAYEIGVMKALFQGASPTTSWEPIEPALFTGTSAGSFNASIMASVPELPAYAAAEYLESVWMDQLATTADRCGNGLYRFRGDLTRLVDPGCMGTHPAAELDYLMRDAVHLAEDSLNRAVNFFETDQSFAARTFSLFNLSSLVNTEPLRQTLDRVLRPAAIQSSFRRLCVAVTGWRDGGLRLFWNEHMTDQIAPLAIMASSAIPGFFPPVEVDGNLYVDGGVVMNTPLKPAIDAGSEVIHVIYLDPNVNTIPVQVLQSTLGTFERMLVMQRAGLINSDVEMAERINQGLDALEALRGPQARVAPRYSSLQSAARLAIDVGRDGKPHREITLHRYHPRLDLGGLLGLLNFDRAHIEQLIAKGFQDTVDHDCGESECVMPDGRPAPRRFPERPLAPGVVPKEPSAV
jgi:predicted acylesterase/phospholipase RssA